MTGTAVRSCDTRRVSIAGRQMAVDIYGQSGQPVLLLHGIPGHRGTWRKVATALADRHRVLVPDLLGFGDSDEPSGDGHARVQATALRQLLDELDLATVHLVGFDFGGPIALTLYREAQARISSMTLVATNVFTDTPIPAPLRVAGLPLIGDLAFRLFFGRAGLSLMWRGAVGDRRAFPKSEYLEYLRSDNGVRWTRRIFLASMRDLPGLYRDVQETLARITVPSAVLWGDRDPFFPLAVGERTARAIPGARLVTLPGCGHFVPEERPAEVAREIQSLIATSDVASQFTATDTVTLSPS